MKSLLATILCSLILTACAAPSDVAVETQVAERIFATQTASVPTPTDTPQPTDTPPATHTPSPTNTPQVAIPARGEYQHAYDVTEEFDRFKGETLVKLDPRYSETTSGPRSLFVSYTYEGNTPAPPPFVGMALFTSSDEWMYLKCHSLAFLLDDTMPIELETEHDGDVGSGYVIEYVSSFLSLEEFLQIVNAQKVEGKLCNDEFQFTDEQMEALRDVASRMQP